MKIRRCFLAFTFLAIITTNAMGQVENADFRIRAKLRTPVDAVWGPDESVGNADFRIKSRFLQIYYGGVQRADDYRFKVQFDYTGISGFATEFVSSPFNTDYDVYINNSFVGRVLMNTTTLGMGELDYDSRNPTPPATLLPPGFPDPVNVFDVVDVFDAAAILPNIADPLPGGVPLFMSDLIEEFARGDANQDGKVDQDDFAFLADNYDPLHLLGAHIGPVVGDFTGDNLADLDDYNLIASNWTDSADVPPEPEAIAVPEPATLVMCLAGSLSYLGFWVIGRRKKT